MTLAEAKTLRPDDPLIWVPPLAGDPLRRPVRWLRPTSMQVAGRMWVVLRKGGALDVPVRDLHYPTPEELLTLEWPPPIFWRSP